MNRACAQPVLRTEYSVITYHPLVCTLRGLVQLKFCAKFSADLKCYMSNPSNILRWTVGARSRANMLKWQRLYLHSSGLC